MLRLLAAIFFLALPLLAAEPAWQVRTWVTDDGLPNNDVPCVIQNRDGAMLFATRGGLARFDGLRFRERPLRASRGGGVSALLSTSAELWAVTQGVIVRQTADGSETVLNMPVLELPGSRETAFFTDTQGIHWLCYEGGRFHRIQGDHIEQIRTADGLSPTFASCAAMDAQGQIWATGPRVLAKWQNDRFEPVAELPKDRCMITRAAAGGVWIGAGRQLLRHTEKGGLQTIAEITDAPANARISTMHEDRAGRLWLGTFGSGLWLYHEHRFQSMALPNSDVWWLAEDREGSLWTSTGGGGVCRIRPRVLTLLDDPAGPRGDVARALCTDGKGDLWVATQNARVFTRRSSQWQELSPGKKINRLCSGIHGDVWLGTSEGNVLHWNGSIFEPLTPPDDPAKAGIVSIFESSTGDLWIGRGYSAWRHRGGQWQNIPLVAESGEVFTFAEGREGNLYAGSNRGFLMRLEGDRFIRLAADELDCTAIRSLLVMPDGALLIAANGIGLARYAEGRCNLITKTHGLPHRNISQLALDPQGRLWAGGDAGIFMVPYEQITAISEGHAESLQVTLFGRSEGLSGLQANASFPGALIEPDGTFWCSTRSGLARIDTRQVGQNIVPPSASIESIHVNDEAPVLLGQLIGAPPQSDADSIFSASSTRMHLEPGIQTLAFEFGSSSFVAPESVRFRYQLEGIDQEPRIADADRRAVYGRIPPGDYTLRVSAANNDGLWSTRDTVLSLRVAPFYHETAWFRALTLCAAAALIIFIGYRIARARYRRRTESLRRQAAIEAERTRIARDMHDQVGASLTQISLLSDIALAQGSDIPQLNRLAETAREAVTALDEIVWAVDPKQDRLDSLLAYLAPQITDLAQAANLRCRLDFPGQVEARHLPAAFRHQLFLIIREAVNNIIKHARATELKLRITPSPSHLTIEITDNGTGFDPTTRKGNGLTNMRTRTQELHGTLEIESTTGTRITATVPWPQS